MKKKTGWVLLLVLSGTLAAAAQDGDTDTVSGSVEIGYRSADVNGNGDKYREDVNLSDGALRLLGLDLEIRPGDTALFDTARIAASGLGGDPDRSVALSLERTGVYDLDVRWRSSDFFYRDAGYWFRDGGDLHTWDARRSFYDLRLGIEATKRLALRFGADRLERDGGSTTSRTLQQDEFVLDRPLDQTAESYWAAADLQLGWADLTVERRLYSADDVWTLTTSNADGIEPGAAFLDDYRQRRHEETDAPITTVSLRGRPWQRLRFSVAYARVDAEVDASTSGDWSGLDFTGASFDTTLQATADLERTTDLVDAEVSLRLTDSIDLLLDYSGRSYDQEGVIDSLEVQTGGAEEGSYPVQGTLTNELDLESHGVGLDWRPLPGLQLSAGVGTQTRDKLFELSGAEVETERTIYRVGVRWRPNRAVDLWLDYEQGNDDDPLTPVSVTTSDRLRLRARVRPTSGLTVSLRYLDITRENDLATALGIPTDDVPPADEISLARFDTRGWGTDLIWSRGRWNALLGWSTTDIELDAHIVYVTGSTFVPVFDVFTTRQSTGYDSRRDVATASLRYASGSRWDAGLRAILVDSTGSFPLESKVYGADGRYDLPRGLYLRLAFDRYDYDENNPFAGDPAAPTPDVNDYDADVWTASLGYRF